jgi:hypothetical protein
MMALPSSHSGYHCLHRRPNEVLAQRPDERQYVTASIHKIGALVQGLPACNGWTFWHFFREGKYEPIDALRSLVRASLHPAAE